MAGNEMRAQLMLRLERSQQRWLTGRSDNDTAANGRDNFDLEDDEEEDEDFVNEISNSHALIDKLPQGSYHRSLYTWSLKTPAFLY